MNTLSQIYIKKEYKTLHAMIYKSRKTEYKNIQQLLAN